MQQNGEPCTEVYKDVVIIGNGPSGICLSYMLAGNWPHYTGAAHPVDDMLTARLRYCSRATQTTAGPGHSTGADDVEEEEEGPAHDSCTSNGGPMMDHTGPTSGCSICLSNQRRPTTNGTSNNDDPARHRHHDHCPRTSANDDDGARCLLGFCPRREDLECLASGLEGRNGGKPLSLLMDQLQRPCLDAGLDVESLIEWRSPDEHGEHKAVDHVVLGKGPPGGTWHTLDPNVLTISSNRWMSLPGLDLRDWQSDLVNEGIKEKSTYYGNKKISVNSNSTRVSFGAVANYYKNYVIKQGLEKYFRYGTVVTSVKSIPGVPNTNKEYGWLVQGYEIETDRPFQYRCKNVVLATGATDSLNRLGVSGEETYSWVTHDFKEYEKKLDQLNSSLRANAGFKDEYHHMDKIKASGVEPVLIVGSGLSAADAIMDARFRGVPVIHAFRNRSETPATAAATGTSATSTTGQQQGVRTTSDRRVISLDKLKWLPASLYPEYHRVYEMMTDRGRNYPLYQSLPDHVVVEFSAGADKYTRAKTRKVTLCTPQGRFVSYRVSCAAVLIGSRPDLSYLQNSGIGLGKKADKPIDNRSNHIDVDVFTYRVERASREGLYAIGPLVGDNFVRFILGGAFGVLADILNTSK